MVMYAGPGGRDRAVPDIFDAPHHPYTEALLSALPEHNIGQRRLRSMAGVVPGAYDRPHGCLLSPRCPYVQDRCRAERPPLFGGRGAQARCFFRCAQGDRCGAGHDVRQRRRESCSSAQASQALPRLARLHEAQGARARARRRVVHAAAGKTLASSANRAAARARSRARSR
jgi:oligopeptide/dipeptide ABC transporter ATP-binding protein